MELIKITLASLLILTSMPASADLSSIFNPFAWIRAAKRSYYLKAAPLQMALLEAQLQILQGIRIETSALKKMYWAAGKAITTEKFADTQLVEGLCRDTRKLSTLFNINQRKWAVSKHIYDITSIQKFEEDILEPAIKKAEQENYVSSSSLPESWYAQLKKAEQRLPKKERNKTTQERENEFRTWQKKYHSSK